MPTSSILLRQLPAITSSMLQLADKNDLQVVPVAGATSATADKEELKNNKDIPSDQVDNIVTAAKAVSAPEISKAAQERSS